MKLLTHFAFRQVTACLLALLLAPAVQATIVFDTSQWSLQADQGTVSYGNGNTTLNITGPTGTIYPSFDYVTVTAPSEPANKFWQLVIDWNFHASASDLAIASAALPGDNSYTFASGGTATSSGTYTVELAGGQSASFMLESQTGAGKAAPSFGFSLDSITVVPEPTAGWWLAALGLALGGQCLKARSSSKTKHSLHTKLKERF